MKENWERKPTIRALFILLLGWKLLLASSQTTLAPTPTLSPAAQLAFELTKTCIFDITKYRFDLFNTTKCPVSYTLACWPELEAGKNVTLQCPGMFFQTDKNVTRRCYANGTWEKVVLRDICNPLPADIAQQNFVKLLAYYNISLPTTKVLKVDKHLNRQIKIFVIMEWISLSIMVPSLLLLFIFPNLNDDKMNLHRCLVFSFLMSVITFLPEYYMSLASKNPRACNAFWIVNRLFAVCEVTWMFNEGLYLLKTIIFVFSQNSHIRLFFLFGWGFPVVLTFFIWTPVMVRKVGSISGRCWTHQAQSNLMLILYVPMTIMLALNLIILIYVIGVVIAKLKKNYSMDMQSKRKAAKGALILMPLLGTIYLMIFYAPKGVLWYDYLLVVTQPLQGILVCVVHVFMNKDIHSAVYSKWRKLTGNTSLFQSTKFSMAGGTRARQSTLHKNKMSVDWTMTERQRKRSSKVAPVMNNNVVDSQHLPAVNGNTRRVSDLLDKDTPGLTENGEQLTVPAITGRGMGTLQNMVIVEECASAVASNNGQS